MNVLRNKYPQGDHDCSSRGKQAYPPAKNVKSCISSLIALYQHSHFLNIISHVSSFPFCQQAWLFSQYIPDMLQCVNEAPDILLLLVLLSIVQVNKRVLFGVSMPFHKFSCECLIFFLYINNRKKFCCLYSPCFIKVSYYEVDQFLGPGLFTANLSYLRITSSHCAHLPQCFKCVQISHKLYPWKTNKDC